MVRWIDSILFNGEPIIQLRLSYMYKTVDTFYICESRYTHQGKRKDVLFTESLKAWFEPYMDKIVFVIQEEVPKGSSWDIENSQRNYAVPKILSDNAGKEYIVSVCDCDEIPDISVVKEYKERLYETTSSGVCYMIQKLFYYNFNWYVVDWNRAFFMNNVLLEKTREVQIFRNRIPTQFTEFVCGWHLSYFMSKEDILRKIVSFAHTEYNLPKHKNIAYIESCIEKGYDVFQRHEICRFQHLPEFVKSLPKEFQTFAETLKELQKL
uniref:Glycosyltransferase n=1 Tax=viral metagenome TaxID=1070528 RepID=A0A6C0DQX5_9ZZZZ